MILYGFDIETYYITNQVAPSPVCVSIYSKGDEHGGREELYKAQDGCNRLKEILRAGHSLCAHNANFDLISLSVFDKELFYLFVKALGEGRIYCTKLGEILLNTADVEGEGQARVNVFIPQGARKWKPVSSNSLAGCAYKYLGVDLTGEKESDLRLSYGDLEHIPLDQWSDRARQYAIDDAKYCHDVLLKQRARDQFGVLDDLGRQTYAEFILQLSSTVIGVQVDVSQIDLAVSELLAAHADAMSTALQYGLYEEAKTERGYRTRTQRVQQLLQRAIDLTGIDHPVTSTGKLSTNKTAMSSLYDAIDRVLAEKYNLDHRLPLSSADIEELAGIQAAFRSRDRSEEAWKEKRTFLDALRGASLNEDTRLRYRYNGLMETGRTSSSSPNLQNIPRGGAARSCIRPRDGYLFIIADYSNAELRTLAQAHLNEERPSRLATEYQRNPHFDPHLFMAVRILGGMTYDEGLTVLSDREHPQYKELKQKRQLSKIANFGYAGGLGAAQFIDYAKGYGTVLTADQASELRNQWLDTWSEMTDYFNTRGDGETTHYRFKSSGRVRYLRKFTIGCNTPFQGIASDGAKEALILVFEECFIRDSPLNGCIPILFIHDELVLEVPFKGGREDHLRASKAARRLSELMEQGMNKHTPDIPAVAEPCLSTEWTKNAESEWEGELLSIYGLTAD